MRSVTNALAAAAALAGSACGNYSTEDVRFAEAMPTQGQVRISVPVQSAQALCGPLGESAIWSWAKPTGDGINAGVDWILSVVDTARQSTPTTRTQDGRVWGPFPDEKHPGGEILIRVDRTYPNGGVEYDFALEGRAGGEGTFVPIFSGTFTGPSARHGSGSITVDFDAVWALQMNDVDSPHGQVQILYDRTGDPRRTTFNLEQSPGFGLAQFGYAWTGFASGNGTFDYAFQDQVSAQGSALVFKVGARFDGEGRGRADVEVDDGSAVLGSFQECWDAQACLVWVHDPANLTNLCTDLQCPDLGTEGGCAVQ